jgi:Tol biopolymer transport system component
MPVKLLKGYVLINFYILKRLLPSVLVILSIGVLTACSEETEADRSLIAFTTRIDNKLEIYTVRGDGKDLTRITNNELNSSNMMAAWSPDRTLIAYQGGRHIHMVNSDGSNISQLTTDSAEPNTNNYDSNPSWSPDGKFLVFSRQISVRGIDRNESQIIKYELDGGIETPIIQTENSPNSPVWSPNADLIMYTAFSKIIDDNNGVEWGVYVSDQNGENSKLILRNATSGSWSPDGQQITLSEGGDGHPKVVVVNNDGSNINVISDASIHAQHPKWSPDGSTIAFSGSPRESGCCSQIFTARPDGSGFTQLTTNDLSSHAQRWSPDSSKLIFIYSAELWVMEADGEALRKIVDKEDTKTVERFRDTQGPSW